MRTLLHLITYRFMRAGVALTSTSNFLLERWLDLLLLPEVEPLRELPVASMLLANMLPSFGRNAALGGGGGGPPSRLGGGGRDPPGGGGGTLLLLFFGGGGGEIPTFLPGGGGTLALSSPWVLP